MSCNVGSQLSSSPAITEIESKTQWINGSSNITLYTATQDCRLWVHIDPASMTQSYYFNVNETVSSSSNGYLFCLRFQYASSTVLCRYPSIAANMKKAAVVGLNMLTSSEAAEGYTFSLILYRNDYVTMQNNNSQGINVFLTAVTI